MCGYVRGSAGGSGGARWQVRGMLFKSGNTPPIDRVATKRIWEKERTEKKVKRRK